MLFVSYTGYSKHFQSGKLLILAGTLLLTTSYPLPLDSHLADERPLRQQHGQPDFILLQTAALRLLHVGAGIFHRSPGWDDRTEDLLKSSKRQREPNSTEQSVVAVAILVINALPGTALLRFISRRWLQQQK